MNPLYQYIIYAIVALIIVGIISFKLYKIYQERGEIKLSRELGKILNFLNKNQIKSMQRKKSMKLELPNKLS